MVKNTKNVSFLKKASEASYSNLTQLSFETCTYLIYPTEKF